jgi:hypothetical protein
MSWNKGCPSQGVLKHINDPLSILVCRRDVPANTAKAVGPSFGRKEPETFCFIRTSRSAWLLSKGTRMADLECQLAALAHRPGPQAHPNSRGSFWAQAWMEAQSR